MSVDEKCLHRFGNMDTYPRICWGCGKNESEINTASMTKTLCDMATKRDEAAKVKDQPDEATDDEVVMIARAISLARNGIQIFSPDDKKGFDDYWNKYKEYLPEAKLIAKALEAPPKRDSVQPVGLSQAIYSSLHDSSLELGGWDNLDDDAFVKAASAAWALLQPARRDTVEAVDCREAFEAFTRQYPPVFRVDYAKNKDGEYKNRGTQRQYELWCAAWRFQ